MTGLCERYYIYHISLSDKSVKNRFPEHKFRRKKHISNGIQFLQFLNGNILLWSTSRKAFPPSECDLIFQINKWINKTPRSGPIESSKGWIGKKSWILETMFIDHKDSKSYLTSLSYLRSHLWMTMSLQNQATWSSVLILQVPNRNHLQCEKRFYIASMSVQKIPDIPLVEKMKTQKVYPKNIAHACMRYLARKYKNFRLVANFIREIYLMMDLSTVIQLRNQLFNEAREMYTKGHLRFHNFVSNSREVFIAISSVNMTVWQWK